MSDSFPHAGTDLPWHALAVGQAEVALRTDKAAGLASDDALTRLKIHGPNLLPQLQTAGPIGLLLHQFKSLLVYVLLAAAFLSLLLGDMLEFAAILTIAALNAVLGFVQEYKAEKALSALKSLTAPTAMVLRQTAPARIAAAEVVPGDVLILEAGDIVSADARIVEAVSLAVSEAALTGESVAVDKTTEPVDPESQLADRFSMAYQGTHVARGRGRAVVVATGGATEVGKIAMQVSTQPREETPLQVELARVGRYLALAAAVLCLVVFAVGVLRGVEATEMLLTAASLAVAAIPEGLPAAATIVLALGVQRMAQRNVIVRRLSSVETLGSVTVVFTDKTGTLTENRMHVQEAWSANDPDDLLLVSVLCNNATLDDGNVPASGDPTEIALLTWAREQDADVADWQRRHPRQAEVPFEAERARMTVVVSNGDRGSLVLVKGAPDVVVERLRPTAAGGSWEQEKQRVLARAAEMAESGMRVLALAKRSLPEGSEFPKVEEDLDLVGLVGLADPIRAEAPAAVRMAQQAGIHVVMLTGDQPATASAIAQRIGLENHVVNGKQVHDLDLNELASLLASSSVFARVTSEHKMRIIQASRQSKTVVAMTGDGVNDAPALRAADIGIAMGKGGTDVAREASDMVLTDDNFSSIVAAIEEGRTIHANIRRFIHFLLSCNTAEILVVFLALVFASETVLTPLQILFVNLVTDGLPALALGVEPAAVTVMHRRPRRLQTAMLSFRSLTPILGLGGLIAMTSLAAFTLGWSWDGETLANRMAFATLVGSQLGASIVFRSEVEPFFRLRRNAWLAIAIETSLLFLVAVFYLPPLQEAFRTGSLSPVQWLTVAILSAVPLLVGEAVKVSGLLRKLHLIPDEME
jgi:Ca2+-transporting ATPase